MKKYFINIWSSGEEIAKTFKKHFDEIAPKFNIIENRYYKRKTENIEDPVKKASFKYRNHLSITNIKDIMRSKIFTLSVSKLF